MSVRTATMATTRRRIRRWLTASTAAVVAGVLALSAGPVNAAGNVGATTLTAPHAAVGQPSNEQPGAAAAAGRTRFGDTDHDLTAPDASESPMSRVKLPNAERGMPYEYQVSADGTGPFTYTLHRRGALPPGLKLESDGRIWGTVAKDAPEKNEFAIGVRDLGGDSKVIAYVNSEITVVDPPVLTLSPKELPDAKPGDVYYEPFETSGGIAPYTYTTSTTDITPNAYQKRGLPPGLRMASDGYLFGRVAADAAGRYVFAVISTDKPGHVVRQEYTLVVRPDITLDPDQLPAATVGQSYDQTLTAKGGKAKYRFDIIEGTPPPGLRLNQSGALTGTPSKIGKFTFTVRATDENEFTAKTAYTVDVNGYDVHLEPTTLPDGTAGQAYQQKLTSPNGAEPVRFTLAKGTLPPGTDLAPDGTLTGTPSKAGKYAFTVKATDNSGSTGIQAYTITVAAPTITIMPATLPDGTAGQPYDQTLTADGGEGPYTFDVTDGTPPAGLELHQSGALTGAPSTVGSYTFTVQAKDANGFTAEAEYTVDVTGYDVRVEPTTLPGGTAYKAYQQKLTAPNGAEPVRFALAKGTLPPGTTLAADGTLTGTPKKAGKYAITVKATDASGSTGTQAYTVTIAAPTITVGPTSLKSAKVGKTYAAQLTSKGGAGPYTYKAVGKLPTGMTLSTKGGLKLAPKKTGTYSFTVQAKDANGHTATKKYALKITK